jgi:cation:H+ antiporter
MGMTVDVLLLVFGIGVLYFGADWLVRGAARLAGSLGVSPMVVGLTIVSFGTSAPELVVCTVAAWGGNPDLAMGNVMGSNLANIGLILGLTSIVRPLEVQSRVVWPLPMVENQVVAIDRVLSRIEDRPPPCCPHVRTRRNRDVDPRMVGPSPL